MYKQHFIFFVSDMKAKCISLFSRVKKKISIHKIKNKSEEDNEKNKDKNKSVKEKDVSVGKNIENENSTTTILSKSEEQPYLKEVSESERKESFGDLHKSDYSQYIDIFGF
jgi:hypothetical protein